MKTKVLPIIIFMSFSILVSAQIIHVPGDHPTIQAGIDAASDGDIVLVDTGLYLENISFKGKAITVKSHYDPLNPDSSFINNTIIDGSQPAHADSGSVVIFVSGESTNSILQGFTIRHGTGTYPDKYGRLSGGGVFCMNSSGSLLHNRIINNLVNRVDVNVLGGAGVCAEGNSNDTLIMNSNTIAYNQGINQSPTNPIGGGGALLTIYGIIENNLFESNYVEGYAHGGGLAFFQSNYTAGVVYNNRVLNNTVNSAPGVGWGGGVYFEWPYDPVQINSNTIMNNTANEGGGIAVWIEYMIPSEYYIENNIIEENHSVNGGGIFINAIKGAVITNNVIANNEGSQNGGGIFLTTHPEKEAIFSSNHLVTNNSSDQGSNKDAQIHNIVNNTFSHNTSLLGGAIASELTVEDFLCFNNIFYNDMATFGVEIYLNSGTVHLHNNNIDTTSQIVGSGFWLGQKNINVDPQFDTVGYHLLPESECIEAGLNSIEVNGETYFCPPIDIDGEQRPLNSFADIGVDECLITRTVEPNLTKGNTIQITPNPVKREAIINFNIEEDCYATLSYYNLNGKKNQVLINEFLLSGNYKVKLDASRLKNGTYISVLKTSKGIQTKKMIKVD